MGESDEQLMKLFKHMNMRFDSMDKQFEKVHKEIDGLRNAIDDYAKQTETYMQEMLALGNKVDRLEQWILKVAEATGVKLTA